jgi:hypothetical protein
LVCRWTITDTTLSPDQRFLLYASISPTVHLLALGGSWDVVESLANVTEVKSMCVCVYVRGGVGVEGVGVGVGASLCVSIGN